MKVFSIVSKVSVESEIDLYAIHISVIIIGVQDIECLRSHYFFSKVSVCSSKSSSITDPQGTLSYS